MRCVILFVRLQKLNLRERLSFRLMIVQFARENPTYFRITNQQLRIGVPLVRLLVRFLSLLRKSSKTFTRQTQIHLAHVVRESDGYIINYTACKRDDLSLFYVTFSRKNTF